MINRFLDLMERYVITQEKLVEQVATPPAHTGPTTVPVPAKAETTEPAEPSERDLLKESLDYLGVKYAKNATLVKLRALLEKAQEPKEEKTEPAPEPPAPEKTEPEPTPEPEAPKGDGPTKADVKDAAKKAAQAICGSDADKSRAFIRSILDKLGVAKLSELDPSKYQECIDLCKESE